MVCYSLSPRDFCPGLYSLVKKSKIFKVKLSLWGHLHTQPNNTSEFKPYHTRENGLKCCVVWLPIAGVALSLRWNVSNFEKPRGFQLGEKSCTMGSPMAPRQKRANTRSQQRQTKKVPPKQSKQLPGWTDLQCHTAMPRGFLRILLAVVFVFVLLFKLLPD